jgi:hypothetical protein
MKKILGLLMYGLAVFGIAAGAGVLLRPKAPVDAHASAYGHGEAESGAEHAPAADGHGETKTAHAPADAHGKTDSHAPAAAHGESESTEKHGEEGHGDEHGKPGERPKSKRDPNDLPVVTRPTPMTVEEIVRYGLGLKARDEVVRGREAALQRMETQQRMVMTDIRGEQRDIESKLAQAREQRLATEELLNRITMSQQKMQAEHKQLLAMKEQELEAQHQKVLEQKKKELEAEHASTLQLKDQERETEKQQVLQKLQALEKEKDETAQQLQSLQQTPLQSTASAGPTAPGAGKSQDDEKETKANRMVRVKELASLIEGVTPDVAATMMMEMANDGQMEMVVELVAGMEPRKATAVLEAVSAKDPKLGVEMLNEYSNLPPKPSKSASKKR